jgi:homoserine kinase type II
LTTTKDDDELVAVLRHYAIGDLLDAHRVEKGFVNDSWDISTNCGRFFLKRRHVEQRRPDIIRVQHDLMRWLRLADFPAPAVHFTTTGDSILDLDGEIYEIQEYIAGEPYDFGNPSHLDEAARTLSRYHRVVESLELEALGGLDELYSPDLARKLLGSLIKAWRLADDDGLMSLARALDAYLRQLTARFSAHRPLPHLVIHGDYYADNLIFDGNRIVGVVDYDKSRWQPRVVEVAEAVIFFASPDPGHFQHLVYPGFLEWEPLERFLRLYTRESALPEHEIYVLPDFVCCIWVQMSLANLVEKERIPEVAEALLELLALAGWARDNAQALRGAAT